MCSLQSTVEYNAPNHSVTAIFGETASTERAAFFFIRLENSVTIIWSLPKFKLPIATNQGEQMFFADVFPCFYC